MARKAKQEKLFWTTKKFKISELIPYEKNPRQMTKEQVEYLKASIEKFNLVEIPAVNADKTIIAGHQRLKIMQLLERFHEEIDVRIPNRQLTEAELKEYNIRSNANTGGWDTDILANFFDPEELKSWGLDPKDIGMADFSDFDETDTAAGGSGAPAGPEEMQTVEIEFLPEDYELFESIMKGIKIKYSTPVLKTQYGLKLATILKEYKSKKK
jgi:hypothetical protein